MTNETEAYPPTPDELDNNPAASDWLKSNWRMAQRRDPFDATQDAAVLHEYCQMRLHKTVAEIHKKKDENNG